MTEDNEYYKDMSNKKPPGNDGLSKEFFETFWEDRKYVFINSLKEATIKGSLSISQRQAITKRLGNKDETIELLKTEGLFRWSMSIQNFY